MLEKICRMTEKELLVYLPKALASAGYKHKQIHATKDYIYAEGNTPVLLVAHVDTVFKFPPLHIFHDQVKGAYWSPEGLGADDRAGVYAILQSLANKPYVLFTVGEEQGAVGAAVFAGRERPPVNYIIELDRTGKDDAVFYDCGNKAFQKYILAQGFREAFGSFSDISVLSPAWDIASVNLSIGYYNQHSKEEYLIYHQLMETIKKVCGMLAAPLVKQFDFQKISYAPWGKYDWWNNTNLEQSAELVYCAGCDDTEIIPGSFALRRDSYYCPDCLKLDIFICSECGEAVDITEESPLDGVCTPCFDEAFHSGEESKRESRKSLS